MLIQVNVVETDKWVEVGDCAEVFLRIRDGLGEVVRDASPRVEKYVAVNAKYIHRDDNSCEPANIMHRKFSNGVVYCKIVIQVCDGKGFFFVIEKDLVLCEKLHPPKFINARFKMFAGPIKVCCQSIIPSLALFVDVIWTARVDKDAPAVVGDDKVVLGAVFGFDYGFFECSYHFDSLEAGFTLNISLKGEIL